jgi:hypothetical protein|tara:strand:- start:308 stop:463 length:156 start_codon:yes stop_codon:yes gene_type:complete
MANYKIIQHTPYGDGADFYFCKADNDSKVAVVVLNKRSDGNPYCFIIEEIE